MYSSMEKQLRTSLEIVLLSVLGTALPWQTRWHSPRCWLCCFLLPTPGKLPLWLLPVCLERHHWMGYGGNICVCDRVTCSPGGANLALPTCSRTLGQEHGSARGLSSLSWQPSAQTLLPCTWSSFFFFLASPCQENPDWKSLGNISIAETQTSQVLIFGWGVRCKPSASLKAVGKLISDPIFH